MKKAVLLAFCLILMAAPGLFSSGQKSNQEKSAGPVEIEWWVGSWIARENDPLARRAYDFEQVFEAEYPNIKVKVTSIAWDGMHEKFILAAKTNTLPHIATSEDFLGWTVEMASTGNMLDLTDFVKNEIGFDHFRSRQLLDQASYKGKIYAVPYRNSTRCFGWNRKHFREVGLNPDKAPKTWKEVYDNGLKLMAGGKFGMSIPLKKSDTVNIEYLRGIIDSWGADVIDAANNKSTINEPAAVEAISFVRDMALKMMPKDIIDNGNGDDLLLLGQEVTGQGLMAPWAIDRYAKSNPDLDYGITTVPSNDPNKIGKSGLVSMGMVVRKDVTDIEKDAIFQFLKMHMRPNVNVWFANSIPVTAEIPKDGKNPVSGQDRKFLEDPRYEHYFKQLGSVKTSALLHPAGPKIAQESNLILQKLILDPKADIKKVLDDAHKTITGYLNEN